jgi:hypothetical protein
MSFSDIGYTFKGSFTINIRACGMNSRIDMNLTGLKATAPKAENAHLACSIFAFFGQRSFWVAVSNHS